MLARRGTCVERGALLEVGPFRYQGNENDAQLIESSLRATSSDWELEQEKGSARELALV